MQLLTSSATWNLVPRVFLGACWSGHCCLAAMKYPPVSLIFTHWWNLFFLLLLRLSISKNNKFLLFESIFVISWLENHGNWDELSVMTIFSFPFPYLRFQSRFAMPCSGKGIQECDGSFYLWGGQASAVHHLQRGEKDAKYNQSQAWYPSFWGQKAVAYMDDIFFHSCLSVAVIQGDEGGLIHMWPLVQRMNSVFAGLMAHPNPPAKSLAQK